MQTWSGWVSFPENSAAQQAVERVGECVCTRGARRVLNPLFVHGPAGTGKTHLVSALVVEVTQRMPDVTAALVPAGDFGALLGAESGDDLPAGGEVDLLVVEDLQHLASRAAGALSHLIDRCLARAGQVVCTALEGPAQLTHLPARLTSRLAAGVVVGLEPLSPASRLAFLEDRARRRHLNVGRPVLTWLAENVPGSARQLEGAISRLEALARLQGRALTVEETAEHFRVEAEARRPTVERIAQRVGSYFRVKPEQLQARTRSRQALLPRQVGMYLARQLTGLSLEQIGAYFGGRDHSTVLHACRKVERALDGDATLSGAVRQLHADLA